MCVIFIAYQVLAEYPVILCANRDEFYERPSLPLGWWEDRTDIYAGRDLAAGGTWLGVTRGGRFAAVTNFRDPAAPVGKLSRGQLVSDFLRSGETVSEYLDGVGRRSDQFSPFNLITGVIDADHAELAYFSNKGGELRALTPGIYGLSNHLLDTPWPKVRNGKERFEEILSRVPPPADESFFDLLSDPTPARDEDLPDTGIPPEREKALSPIFIETPDYGTRCSTLLRFDSEGKWQMEERTFV